MAVAAAAAFFVVVGGVVAVVDVTVSSLSVASLSGDGGCGALGPGPFKLLL